MNRNVAVFRFPAAYKYLVLVFEVRSSKMMGLRKISVNLLHNSLILYVLTIYYMLRLLESCIGDIRESAIENIASGAQAR